MQSQLGGWFWRQKVPVCLGSYPLDVTAVVGAVGDPVAGDVQGSWHPAHPQHTVGDLRELNTRRRWEEDCVKGQVQDTEDEGNEKDIIS